MSASSHGQRFRRRAMRRGYKVDEVDTFLDRVEATLNGTAAAPISAQDVHDVVFRVRFGGYDEWQVDLHLDRVERQVAELEERSAPPGVGAQLRAAMGAPTGDRGLAPPPLPVRSPGGHQPTSTLPRFDQQPSYEPAPPRRDEPAYAQSGGYSNLSDTGGFGGYGQDLPQRRTDQPGGQQVRDPYGSQGSNFATPVPPTSSFRPPLDRPYDAMTTTTGSFRPVSAPPGAGAYGPPPPSSGGGAETQRVDQLRRTFQLRRFGSGYDPGQVDRLFENVLGALSGRGGVNDSELDASRLNLVPGGYYEAEVDQAIREVREILRAR